MKRVALVLFTEPFLYPPTFHAAEILAANGWMVDIFGLRIPNVPAWQTSSKINTIYFDQVRAGPALRVQFIRYVRFLREQAGTKSYCAVIGYDMMGAWPAYRMARMGKSTFVYHNHDLMLKCTTKHVFYRFVKHLEEFAARRADLVTFPQAQRGSIFCSEAKLQESPRIVYNSPRLDWRDASQGIPGELDSWLKKAGPVVLYQGGLLRHRGIFALLESVRHWNFEGSLLLIGLPLEEGILENLNDTAVQLKVQNRIRIHTAVSHDVLASVTARATIGIGVLHAGNSAPDDPQFINLKHLAGASNKIFEYMAYGLPIVCCRGAGFEDLLEANGHGVLCDGKSPESIAQALNLLMSNPALRAEIQQRNIAAFQTQYAFEHQFKPVFETLEAACE